MSASPWRAGRPLDGPAWDGAADWTLADELLRPSVIYTPAVLALLDAGVDVHAVAHITGGGLPGMPSALLLAKIYCTPAFRPESLQLVDTRVRGGGLPEDLDLDHQVLPGDTVREAQTYLDIGGWDGEPVPLAGVVIIDLPAGIRDGTPGYTQFSEAEILEIVNQHCTAGVRAVLRYV